MYVVGLLTIDGRRQTADVVRLSEEMRILVLGWEWELKR
jgi:anti-sigma-K factor RskA